MKVNCLSMSTKIVKPNIRNPQKIVSTNPSFGNLDKDTATLVSGLLLLCGGCNKYNTDEINQRKEVFKNITQYPISTISDKLENIEINNDNPNLKLEDIEFKTKKEKLQSTFKINGEECTLEFNNIENNQKDRTIKLEGELHKGDNDAISIHGVIECVGNNKLNLTINETKMSATVFDNNIIFKDVTGWIYCVNLYDYRFESLNWFLGGLIGASVSTIAAMTKKKK